MLDILIFITLTVMAIRAAIAIHKNTDIFFEFNQSKILSALVLLYPIGPLLLFFATVIFPTVILFMLAITCYVPGFVVSHRQQRAFECAGTSRLEQARNSVSLASCGAIQGYIYLSLVIAFTLAIKAYSDGI